MPHVVLLGDSIFDNGVYVSPDPDVIQQLRVRLGPDWKASLLAVDGHVTADVLARQLPRLPRDATHLAVSVGGNDALGQSGVLTRRVASVGEAVAMLGQARMRFRGEYRALAASLNALGRRIALCTIYDANYPAPQGPIVAAALSLFNDVITREAFAHGFDLIDLRLICDQPEDYANPIEPSSRGGAKIAAAIAAHLQDERVACGSSRVWVHGRDDHAGRC